MSLIEVMVASTLMLVLLYLMFAFLVPTLHASARGEVRVQMEQQAAVTLGRICSDLAESGPAGVSLNNNVYDWLALPAVESYLEDPTNNPSPAPPSSAPGQPTVIMAIQKMVTLDAGGNQQWNTDITGQTQSGIMSLYVWDAKAQTVTWQGVSNAGPVAGGVDLTQAVSSPLVLTDPQLTTLATATSPHTILLASGVTSFTISYPFEVGAASPIQPFVLPDSIETQNGFSPSPITIAMTLSQAAATGSTKQEVASFSRTLVPRNTL